MITQLTQFTINYAKALGKKRILQTKTQNLGKVDFKALTYKPQAIGDSVQLSQSKPSLLDAWDKYFAEYKAMGKDFKPTFKDSNSVLALYDKNREKKVLDKILKKNPSIMGLRTFIFENIDKLNISKNEYYSLVDKISKEIKAEVIKNPKGLRKEFVDNADKIHKWAEIFATQHFNKVTKKNILHKFYDENMYNNAVQEYTEFVEKMTGKKLLIGCPSRMNFPITALGMLNDPKTYKDFDYILLGHGKGSSLITNIKDPNTWRFSDNDKSVYEFIEQNVPKGKKVLAFTCEVDGLKLAGKASEDMVDRAGTKMFNIGHEVSGWWKESNGVKIIESGIRHIKGNIYSSKHSSTTIGSTSGFFAPQGFGQCFTLNTAQNPIIKYYDLDYSKYKV